MKYLTLIRHAKSGWDNPGLTDHDRVLNERGIHCAGLVGRFLAKMYLGEGGGPALLPKPDRLYSSTAVRAKTTAELMQPELGVGAERLVFDSQVYLSTPKTLLQIVKSFDDNWRHVMVFAHNPGISDFADRLVKRGGIEQMPTAAAALIELPWDCWSATNFDEARLVGFITPRLIERRFLGVAEGLNPPPGSEPILG